MRIFHGIILISLIFCSLTLTLKAKDAVKSGITITVPDDYPIIQAAVDAASDGDTVFVRNGVYYEHVIINRMVSLIGESKEGTIVNGNGTDAVFRITRSSVNITSFTVQNSGVYSQPNVGIFIDGTGVNCHITKNNIIGHKTGVLIRNAWSISITENNIEGNTESGLNMWIALGNNVTGNNVTNNVCGVVLDESPGNLFYHNNLLNNTQDVQDMTPAHPSICIWDDGYPSGGNYWSKYSGTDANYDGIYDTPCVIDSDDQDNYPLTHPYGSIQNLVTSLVYLTIQSAVDAPETLDGHTIFVRSGAYCENVVVNKSVSLAGENRECTIIYPGSTGAVFTVTSSNVKISGFTVSNSHYGIALSRYSSNNTITRNMIYCHSEGIYLRDSSYNAIVDNVIAYCTNTYLSGNGILIVGGNDNRIENNSIRHNENGIFVSNSCRNIILNNDISENDNVNVYLWQTLDTTVSNNSLAGSTHSIFQYAGSNDTMFANTISNAYNGITVEDPWSESRIFHNNLINNVLQAQISPSDNATWHSRYSSGGNYWSDYCGVDLYSGQYQNETGSDGIGDSAYIIDANNTDSYPLMKTFPWSEHDIGITYIGRIYSFDFVVPLKTIVGLGFSLDINAFVMNYGSHTETFNVEVFANDTSIGNFENFTLISLQSAVLNLRWNTTGFAYGNYTIRAVAGDIPGETDILDNVYMDDTVYLCIPGDVNGDAKVDIKDIGYIAIRFSRSVLDSNWSANADLNDDEKIDMRDIGNAATHFMESYA